MNDDDEWYDGEPFDASAEDKANAALEMARYVEILEGRMKNPHMVAVLAAEAAALAADGHP